MPLLINLAKYGVGSAGLMWLVYQGGEYLPKIFITLNEVKTNNETLIKEHADLENTLERYMDISVKLQRANCLNTAETKEERLNCNQ